MRPVLGAPITELVRMQSAPNVTAAVRSGLRDEGGQSLVLALVAMLALIISGATVISVVTSNQGQSSYQRQAAGALSAATAVSTSLRMRSPAPVR